MVPEGQIVKLTPYQITLYDKNQVPAQPEYLEVNWNIDSAMKNGFPHFMLKEIYEQPEALRNTILPRMSRGLPDFTDDQIPDSVFESSCHCMRHGHACRHGGKSFDGTALENSRDGFYCVRISL